MEKCCWPEEPVGFSRCQAGLIMCDTTFMVPCSSSLLVPQFQLGCGYGYPESSSVDEDKSASTLKNHSEAEKRRRDRINAHLDTLRKLISNNDKMDKAALLGTVVQRVKELKRRVTDLSKVFTLPTDVDEVVIDSDSNPNPTESSVKTISSKAKENVVIKASFCCDDRSGLFAELNHALKSLRLTVVHVEMTSLGGRIRGSFLLGIEDRKKRLDGMGMNTLKQSLRVVLGRIMVSSSSTSSNYRMRSKRQRFFFPSDHH